MTTKIKDSVPLTASSLCVRNYNEIPVYTAHRTSIGSFKLDNQTVQKDLFKITKDSLTLGYFLDIIINFIFFLLIKLLHGQAIPE